MKAGFFFIILAVVVAAVLITGCVPQAEPPKQPEHDLFTEKGQSKNVTECVADSDCGIGGCSGQVCTTAEDASGLITTCEYREEYGCLRLTSCGCVDGKCAWKETAGYKSCIDNITSPQQQ